MKPSSPRDWDAASPGERWFDGLTRAVWLWLGLFVLFVAPVWTLIAVLLDLSVVLIIAGGVAVFAVGEVSRRHASINARA